MAAGGGAGNGHTWDCGAYPRVRQDAGHGSDTRDGGISWWGSGDPRRQTGNGCDAEVGAGGEGDTWFVEARNARTGRYAAARCFRCVLHLCVCVFVRVYVCMYVDQI